MRTLARMLLAAVFIQGGWEAYRHPEPRAPRAARLGLPEPELLTRANGAAMIAGGAALALGIKPRVTAALLCASLVPTTLAGHPFWTEETESARKQQLTQFMKNVSLLGGLLAVASDPGHDRRRQA